MPNAMQRNSLSKLLNTHPRVGELRGYAFTTDSRLARGVLTAVNWATKKPFAERVFGNPWETARTKDNTY